MSKDAIRQGFNIPNPNNTAFLRAMNKIGQGEKIKEYRTRGGPVWGVRVAMDLNVTARLKKARMKDGNFHEAAWNASTVERLDNPQTKDRRYSHTIHITNTRPIF